VGALINPMSSVIRPRKRGKTVVAQTKSATRKRGITSKRLVLIMTAGTLTATRSRRLIHFPALPEDVNLRMSLLKTPTIPTCRESILDAQKAVTRMSTRTCHPAAKGSRRSKKERYASFTKVS